MDFVSKIRMKQIETPCFTFNVQMADGGVAEVAETFHECPVFES